MLSDRLSLICVIGFALLTAALTWERRRGRRRRLLLCLRPLWVFFAALGVAAWWSTAAALAILALFSFFILREYFSLADFRLEDRLGMGAAYLSIPLMMYLVLIDWYGFFIVSIPVYAFLVVPFLVVLGGRDPRGSVFSIGAIDFGLFLFVYCMGHLAYLIRLAAPLALVLVVIVALCDQIDRRVRFPRAGALGRWFLAVPVSEAILLPVAGPAGLETVHAAVLGLLVPTLVLAGNFTVSALEQDLGIAPDELEPGRGLTLDAVKAYLFTAPAVFHYLRYATEIL